MKKPKNGLFKMLLLILILLFSIGSVQGETSADSLTDSQTFTGYLIDEDCFMNPDYVDPSTETRGCQLMPNCAASGYGIAVLENNGYYKFYYLEGEISTVSKGKRIEKATKGQEKAWNFIKDTVLDTNVPVTVKGTLSNTTKTNPNTRTADGITYPVVIVDSISAIQEIPTYAVKMTGYLVDAQSFLKAKTTEADPAVETKMTLKTDESARSGYGIAVKQKDGTYKFYYFDGKFAPSAIGGQKTAAGILLTTIKKERISVDVTGEYKGKFYKLKGEGPQFNQYPNPVVTVASLSETSMNYTGISLIVLIVIVVAASSAVIIKRRLIKR